MKKIFLFTFFMILGISFSGLYAAMYHVQGQALGQYYPTDEVTSQSFIPIPNLDPNEPEPVSAALAPDTLPGVTIEIYETATNQLLGTGQADVMGFYHVQYIRSSVANHTIRFMVYLDDEDGGREFIGELDTTTTGDPILVNSLIFSFLLTVPLDKPFIGGSFVFNSLGEFMFVEVGDVDMDDIYDEQNDAGTPGLATKKGRTKASAGALGPDYGFGSTLELYGLFGAGDPARYYKIHYDNLAGTSGTIKHSLYKKNYVISGMDVEVYNTKIGPHTITIGANTMTDVYYVEEFLAGTPITGHPGKMHSTFWTEVAMRAKWNTQSPALPDGKYVLSIIAYDVNGAVLPAASYALNNFATLNLHLMNTKPECRINNIQYMNGAYAVHDGAECDVVYLDLTDGVPSNDNLKFDITAKHSDASFFKYYHLDGWYGHSSKIKSGSSQMEYSPSPADPSAIIGPWADVDYHTCAFRFRLRVVPKITNGYYHIYVRDDNWYVSMHEIN